MCSFSIASSGKRCLLETLESDDGTMEFQCKTSQVVALNFHEYIESDECVSACGVDRNWVGISSDSLLDSHFTLNLCSSQCYRNCPNIVELYYNLALAEGDLFLPELCKSQRTSRRRSVIQLQSSSAAAGPVSALAAGPMAASAPTAAASIFYYAPAPM
ncbi:hypothetical protein Pfo_018253 [Paulownia fortunei]|nr:hypothetical protein Pfo_018253 [Paulownia fortunei]